MRGIRVTNELTPRAGVLIQQASESTQTLVISLQPQQTSSLLAARAVKIITQPHHEKKEIRGGGETPEKPYPTTLLYYLSRGLD